MEDHEDLDDILDTSRPSADEPEPVEAEPEPQPEEGKGEEVKAEEPKGDEKPDGDEPKPDGATPAPEQKLDVPTVPVEALRDERQKRQELERRLSQIEAERSKTPAPDQFEDPEGYQKWQDDQVSERLFTQKCNLSRAVVVMTHGEDDFSEKEAAFNEAAAKDPSLMQQAAQAELPALFIYQHGEAQLKRQAIGDPDTYEARIREQIEKEMSGKVEALAEAKVKELLSKHLPKSLAEEQSQSERDTGGKWEGPEALDSLMPN